MVRFREDPENPARIVVPSGRTDEIGIAERELGAMQRDLASMLQQKSHLAALGLAVSKINHDLRNLLASAQLFSDRLASVPDPNVQRFAPQLMRSLERAIAFCQSTLSYGQVKEPPPDRKIGAARSAGRGSARDAWPLARVAGALDHRGRARAACRCGSGPVVPRHPQSGAQCAAGAGKPRAKRARSRPVAHHRPARGRGRGDRGVRHRAWRDARGHARTCSRRSRARHAAAVRGLASRSPPSWCAPMAARSGWSMARSARPSASSFPTGRSNSAPGAASGRGPEARALRACHAGSDTIAMRPFRPGHCTRRRQKRP